MVNSISSIARKIQQYKYSVQMPLFELQDSNALFINVQSFYQATSITTRVIKGKNPTDIDF